MLVVLQAKNYKIIAAFLNMTYHIRAKKFKNGGTHCASLCSRQPSLKAPAYINSRCRKMLIIFNRSLRRQSKSEGKDSYADDAKGEAKGGGGGDYVALKVQNSDKIVLYEGEVPRDISLEAISGSLLVHWHGSLAGPLAFANVPIAPCLSLSLLVAAADFVAAPTKDRKAWRGIARVLPTPRFAITRCGWFVVWVGVFVVAVGWARREVFAGGAGRKHVEPLRRLGQGSANYEAWRHDGCGVAGPQRLLQGESAGTGGGGLDVLLVSRLGLFR